LYYLRVIVRLGDVFHIQIYPNAAKDVFVQGRFLAHIPLQRFDYVVHDVLFNLTEFVPRIRHGIGLYQRY